MDLKEARKARGLSQKELAEIVGITNVTLSLIENNKVFPTQVTRDRLQKVLNVSINFYPVKPQTMWGMISKFVGDDIDRGKEVKNYVDRVIEVSRLDIYNTKA